MSDDLSKQNKQVVVVAGGFGYLGSFIVDQLIANDFKVVVICRQDNQTSALTDKDGVYFFAADITDYEAILKVATEVKNIFGSVFAVIQATGATCSGLSIFSGSALDFSKQFAVNVSGSFNLFKAFKPIISDNGAIIGITSKAIEAGANYMVAGAYLLAKQALRNLLKALARELQTQSIRVYAVAPAFMPGGLNSNLPPKVMEFIQVKSKPEDITKPEAVAQVVIKLINDKAKTFSGQSITVPEDKATDL